MTNDKKSSHIAGTVSEVAYARGVQVSPHEFQKILDRAPIVTEIGEPKPIKSVSSPKGDNDDQY